MIQGYLSIGIEVKHPTNNTLQKEADELLRRTAQVLDQLPNAVSRASATQQRAPGGNKACAVII